MKPKELGEKLKKARELANISQQEAAEVIDKPRTAISQIESGNRKISTLELTQLAKLYHHPVTYFLEESDPSEEDIVLALYRIDPELKDHPEVKDQVYKYIDWCQQGYSLEQQLGRDHRHGPPTYPQPVPKNTSKAVEQGEEVADQERKRLDLGFAPIADMADLVNEQDVWASGAELPDKMSGLFLCHSSLGIAVFVNSEHVRGRKRFSYAHEYAHVLLDREWKITISSEKNSSELMEKRANAFAGAFLMPKEGVAIFLDSIDKGKPSREDKTIWDVATQKGINTSSRSTSNSQRIIYQDIALMAYHFGVSYQAATYRLKTLNYLTQGECDHLFNQVDMGNKYLKELNMSDDINKKEDKKYSDRELRSHIAHLAIEAYRREEISKGKLLEISKSLGISTNNMLSLAEAACEP